MTPYYNTPARIGLLLASAKSWEGTPFIGNACVKGKGACCYTLCGAIYSESQFLPPDFQLVRPGTPMGWSNAHKESLLENAMAALSDKFANVTGSKPQAGDLLGFRMGKCVHHCGLMVDSDRFIHVYEKTRIRTVFSTMRDSTFSSHLAKLWRPLQ
jgi:cell wall-associated NlpC family hydrolase